MKKGNPKPKAEKGISPLRWGSGRNDRVRRFFLAAAAGGVMALALPKPGFWPASWLGLALLFVAVRNMRVRTAALMGLVTGAVYFGVILFWITLFGGLPWVLLVIFESVFFAGFAAAASALSPDRTGRMGYVAIPAAWTAMQWLRSLGPYALTWGSFAHTQADVLPVIQIASVTGPWGIDFLLCLANLALAGMVFPTNDTRRVWAVVVTAALIAATVAYGYVAMGRPMPSGREIKVAVIQGSLTHAVNPKPGFTSEAFGLYRDMTLRAAKTKPDMIIWPETTIPEIIAQPGWGSLLSRLAAQTRTTLMVGGYDASPVRESYNAVHAYGRRGEKLGVYRKVHLVPFGEFVPMRDRLPFLRNYGIRAVDVLPGKSHNLIGIGPGKIGTSICFESLFPQISRVETLHGAELLCILTNDAWFGRTQAANQHLMMARLRAVETRRYVVRSASTGVSALIDPCGRSIAELGMFKRGVLTGSVRFREGLTPYVRFGDWFAHACVGLVAVALLVRFTRRGAV